MSTADVLAIIDRIKKVEFVPSLKSVTGSYRFEVVDVGSWRVDVERGRISSPATRLEGIVPCAPSRRTSPASSAGSRTW